MRISEVELKIRHKIMIETHFESFDEFESVLEDYMSTFRYRNESMNLLIPNVIKFHRLKVSRELSPNLKRKRLFRFISPEEWESLNRFKELRPSKFYGRIHASIIPDKRYKESGSRLIGIEAKPEHNWKEKLTLEELKDNRYYATEKAIPIEHIELYRSF